MPLGYSRNLPGQAGWGMWGGKGTHFSHFLLAVPGSPVYIPTTSCTDSSVVERLFYTQLVGGSSPSPCTTNKPRKLNGLRGFLLWVV